MSTRTERSVPAGSADGQEVRGPAVPRADVAVLHPLPGRAMTLAGEGHLGAWQALNRDATIPHCTEQLEASGNLDNLRRLTGETEAPFRGFWFQDTDVYKTLEGIAWDQGRPSAPGPEFLDATVRLLSRVQETDGYIGSWVQGVVPEQRWQHLEFSHEMYNAGHLVQAAVALYRSTGRTDLLEVARRFADLLVETFGEHGREAVDGHPEVETALVELYRTTGHRAYLDLAQRMVELRGRGLLANLGRFGPAYFQDHAPVREATEATGHAVRQLYLAAGVTDVYLETGDRSLLEAMESLWTSAYLQKTYLTGGHGSRHRDEAFGDPYELPPDRAYAETCAAIAAFHWNWRMLLATGEARYAEEMERGLYNAIAASTSLDGTRFSYSNPLQQRSGHDGSDEDSPSERLSWYACACCPPNLARLVASLHHYVATRDAAGVQLHLLTSGRLDLHRDGASPIGLSVVTDYPWNERVLVDVDPTDDEFTLSIRVPAWCHTPTLAVDGTTAEVTPENGYLRLRRDWHDGARLELRLPMDVRLVRAHPHVDAVRGCVALARGPLVYCIEQADHADAVLEDLRLDPARPPQAQGDTGVPGVPVTLVGPAVLAAPPSAALYAAGHRPVDSGPETQLTAIPYFRWANRGANAMRVWIPTVEEAMS